MVVVSVMDISSSNTTMSINFQCFTSKFPPIKNMAIRINHHNTIYPKNSPNISIEYNSPLIAAKATKKVMSHQRVSNGCFFLYIPIFRFTVAK